MERKQPIYIALPSPCHRFAVSQDVVLSEVALGQVEAVLGRLRDLLRRPIRGIR